MRQLTEAELKLKYPEGRSIRYVPYHAEGDASHPDCQNGVVSSVRNTTVFCRFTLGGTAEGCNDDQLTGGIEVTQEPEPLRASGDAICSTCGKAYKRHRLSYEAADLYQGYPYLNVLCDGTKVKL